MPVDMERRARTNKVILGVAGGLAALMIGVALIPSGESDSPVGEREPKVRVEVRMLEAFNRATYLEEVAKGLPAGVEIANPELVRYGLAACEYTDGYLTGSTPTPSDKLAADLQVEGFTEDDAYDIADAARNAGAGVLCAHDMTGG